MYGLTSSTRISSSRPEARLQNVTAEELVVEILDATPVPMIEGRTAPTAAREA